MAVIDEATRIYFDEHFERIYAKIDAMRDGASAQQVSIAEIKTNQSQHQRDIEDLKSRQWQGVTGLLAALTALVAQFVTSRFGGH